MRDSPPSYIASAVDTGIVSRTFYRPHTLATSPPPVRGHKPTISSMLSPAGSQPIDFSKTLETGTRKLTAPHAIMMISDDAFLSYVFGIPPTNPVLSTLPAWSNMYQVWVPLSSSSVLYDWKADWKYPSAWSDCTKVYGLPELTNVFNLSTGKIT